MSKYTIVSKPKGNKKFCVYPIKYQVEGYGSTIFECELYCMSNVSENDNLKELSVNSNGVAYVYLDCNEYPMIGEEDKVDFLKELYAFQTGSAYRRKHPIKYSDIDELKNKKLALIKQVQQIEDEIQIKINNECESEYNSLMQTINCKELDDFTKDLKALFNKYPRYSLKVHSYSLYIYDDICKINIKQVEPYSDCIDIIDIDKREIINEMHRMKKLKY